MADIAKMRGTFVLGTGEVPGSKSVHLLEWQGGGRRRVWWYFWLGEVLGQPPAH